MLYKTDTHFKVYLNKIMHMQTMLSYCGQTNAPDKLVYLYEMYNNFSQILTYKGIQGLIMKTITL